MKRIVLDVPRWHAYLHRDARGLETATERDGPVERFADELFDRLYSDDTERLPEKKQDAKLRAWADAIHSSCEQLPAFARLASECRGDAMAAGTAVEMLLGDLRPEPPQEPGNTPTTQLGPSRRVLGGACEKASAAIEDLRERLEGLAEVGFRRMPGSSSGVGGNMPPHAIRALAARLKSDARLKQIALLAGRFKRIAATKRRQKLKHGADEIADVEQGSELARLLPSELVRLAHPKLRSAFMRTFVERAALQYQLVGNEPLGKGPLVVVLDKSGSMDGPRDTWSTALTLALLDQARRERRTFALVCFDYQVKFEAVVKPGEPLPEQGLFVGCAGGTEISVALHRGLHLIEQNQGALKKADIVLVTDGGSDTAAASVLRERAQQLGVTLMGIGIGVEREWLQPWCDDVQTITELTSLDDTSATALFAS